MMEEEDCAPRGANQEFNGILYHQNWFTVYLRESTENKNELVVIREINMTNAGETANKLIANEIDTHEIFLNPQENILEKKRIFREENEKGEIEDKVFVHFGTCDGGNLRSFLIKHEKIPEQKARQILKEILMGLKFLRSKGIILRALMPECIFFNKGAVKIADYGYALHEDSTCENHVDASDYNGYMAPEIMEKRPYSSKCDVWSVGLIFYEMLFGKNPAEKINASDLMKFKISELPSNPLITQDSMNFIYLALFGDQSRRLDANRMFKMFLDNEASATTKACKEETETPPCSSQNTPDIIIVDSSLPVNRSLTLVASLQQELIRKTITSKEKTLDKESFTRLFEVVFENSIPKCKIHSCFEAIDFKRSGLVKIDDIKSLLFDSRNAVAYFEFEQNCLNNKNAEIEAILMMIAKYITLITPEKLKKMSDFFKPANHRVFEEHMDELDFKRFIKSVPKKDAFDIDENYIEKIYSIINPRKTDLIFFSEFIQFFENFLNINHEKQIKARIALVNRFKNSLDTFLITEQISLEEFHRRLGFKDNSFNSFSFLVDVVDKDLSKEDRATLFKELNFTENGMASLGSVVSGRKSSQKK